MQSLYRMGRHLLAALLFAAPVMAIAQDNDGREAFICAIGGEAFHQAVAVNFFPLESLPNGSSPGGDRSDIMVPICPGNGLAMAPKYDGNEGDPEAFADYSPAELAQLPALIASPAYKALSGEAAYWRLYWLATKLGRPVAQRFHLLQHVSWVGVTPELHRANLERFVTDADVLIADPAFDANRRTLARYYVANALRELGQFDAAKARLLAMQAEWELIVAKLVKDTPVDPNFETDFLDEQGVDVASGYGFGTNITQLLAAVEARDNDYFPVSLMGDKWANAVCRNVDDSYPPATAMTKANCAKRMKEKADYYAHSQTDYQASQALLANPAKLNPLCKATPKNQREPILAEACRLAEYNANQNQMTTGSALLLKNPKALDLQCKPLTFKRYDRPKTALGMACQKRREVLNEAEATALVAKFRAQPAEYERLCTMDYPESFSENPVETACARAQDDRDDARDAQIDARLAKMSEAEIWAECAAKETAGNANPYGVPMAVPYTALTSRCSNIRSDREEAAWTALEADPAKLAATCALPDAQQEEWQKSRCYNYHENIEEDAAMAMAKDHSALVNACDSTPMPQRDRILYKACRSYRKCVIMRVDELPFDDAAAYATTGPQDGSQPAASCFDSVEKADAAFAQYRVDPKSMRIGSCEHSESAQGDPYQAETCARYARGENVYAEHDEPPYGEDQEMSAAEAACLKKAAGKKYTSASDTATAAGAATVLCAAMTPIAPRRVERK